MEDRTFRYNKKISDEELEKKLKQMKNPEGYETKNQFKILEPRRKDIKRNKKILGILGGIISFFTVYALVIYIVILMIISISGVGVLSLLLFGVYISLVISSRMYNILSGDNFDINAWITDLYT
jgi:phage shock protein PspC (stress-responsive transcriptional regulator)